RMSRWKYILATAIALATGGVARSDDTGLLLYLPLAQDFRDHSPYHHPVTPTNRVEIKDGAAYFPGDESWLEAPYLALNDRAFAISLWVKLANSYPMFGLVEQQESTAYNHWMHLMLRGARQPYIGF